MSLKNLIPFRYPARTQTPPFEHMPKSLNGRYIKIKEPLSDPETSKRIYWREVSFGDGDDQDHDHGCFFFLERLKITIRRTIDKWFGPLFGLPKFDEFLR